jgi:ammonia channel protein AmtB
MVIGILAALTYTGLEHVMLVCKLDDPLDGFAVHFGGGLVGIIMTPFFMLEKYSYGLQNEKFQTKFRQFKKRMMI